MREYAARALGQIGPVTKEVIPALIDAMDRPADYVRNAAAEALGAMGPQAKEAVPQLEFVAEKDPDSAVRRAARDALEKIQK
jgi:HEAT repeat protein